jgi:hypothetical protein
VTNQKIYGTSGAEAKALGLNITKRLEMNFTLTRFKYGTNETVGRLVNDTPGLIFFFWTIENPWLDNAPNISCIPEGLYYLERYNSPSHGANTWQFINVPNRTFCQIHVANYASDVSGCIGLGSQVMSGMEGVSNSRNAMDLFTDMTADLHSLKMTINSGVTK